MGRVARYRKVKRTVRDFGKARVDVKANNPIPVAGHTVVNGFTLEPDNNKKLIVHKGKGKRRKKRPTAKPAMDLKIKPGETLKDFSQRVDRNMRPEVSKMARDLTSTSQKRKAYQKNRKLKEKRQRKDRIERKLASKEDEEAELIYQGLKPFKPSNYKQKTRQVGVNEVAETPPELEMHDKRRFSKLSFMQNEK